MYVKLILFDNNNCSLNKLSVYIIKNREINKICENL